MKMAGFVWVTVVLFSVHQVFGKECNGNMKTIFNCDECVKCGGYWCNKPAPGTKDERCTLEPNNGWCPHDEQVLGISEDKTVLGNQITPISIHTTTVAGISKTVQVYYAASAEQKAHIKITQGKETDLNLKMITQCNYGNCTLSIDATPKDDLCPANGTAAVNFSLKLTVDTLEEDVEIQYSVPCGCKCSERKEFSSKMCNGRGDYSCGTCVCHSGWTGESCEQCSDRGDSDVTCKHSGNGLDCYGNGVCDPCGNCNCYTDRPGSQYFNVHDNCADLCWYINSRCDLCLLESSTENEKVQCEDCKNLFLVPYNKTEASDRNVWVTCNNTMKDEGKDISYFTVYEASKLYEKIFVMIHRSWNSDSNEVIVAGRVTNSVQITVPAIVGIVGLIAATAAVAGYMVWKHRSPPLPLMDPSYQNIGAEDCTGVNPLYKPPNTTFINPTYKK